MKKIIISAILLLTMVLSLASCSLFQPGEEEFYIDGASYVNMQVGEIAVLEVVKPDSLKGKVEWTSDDETVVIVANGTLVAKGDGTTMVHATLGDYTDKVIVTVGTGKPNTNGNTGSGNTSGGNTSGGNTSGGNTSGGNTSGGNTSGGNTSGGNTSGGNTSGGSSTTGNLLGSIDFSDVNQRTSCTTECQVWQNGNATLTNNKAGSSSDVSEQYSCNPARFYKNSDVIIECQGMTKLVIVCGEAANGNDYASLLVNSISDSSVTVTSDGTTVTIVFSAPVNSFTYTSTAGQTRFMSLQAYGN